MQSCNPSEEFSNNGASLATTSNADQTAPAPVAMDFDVEQLFELDPYPLQQPQQQRQQQHDTQQPFRSRASTWDPSFKRPKLTNAHSGNRGPTGLYINCQSPLMQLGEMEATEDVAMLPVSIATGPACAPSSCQDCFLSVPSGSGSTPSPGLASLASQLSAPAGLSSAANLSPQQQQQQQQQKRRNAWGSQSYADLITQAIESNPQGRLTLSEIYDWMIKNIPYFGSRSDAASSAGWKNSVRHNLSLHNKFVRIQNDQTGKSSYWTINYEARDRQSTAAPGAAPATGGAVGPGANFRRRAATADAPRSVDLQTKRAAVLARRQAAAAAAAAAVTSTNCSTPSQPPDSSRQPAENQLLPTPPPPFTVAEVMRDLVPDDQLLANGDFDTDQLLFESLTDAVLNTAGGPSRSEPPVQSLTQQMNYLTCQQQQQQQQQQLSLLSSSSSGIGASWYDSAGESNTLPDILEIVDNLEQQQQQQGFGFCSVSSAQQQQQFPQYQQSHIGYMYHHQQPPPQAMPTLLAPQHQHQQQQQQQQQLQRCNCGGDVLMQEQA